MSEEKKKKISKPRATKYEEKVTFNGSFEDIIKVSVKHGEKKLKERKNP